MAYLGSSTLLSVMLLSRVLLQPLLMSSVFLSVSMTVLSEPVTEDARLVLITETAGSRGELELAPAPPEMTLSGSGSGSEECWWLKLLNSEQT